MKGALNTNCWSYISVTMYNELERVCIGCEAILTLKKESYRNIIDFVLDYLPQRTGMQMCVVADDCAINQSTYSSKAARNIHLPYMG